MNFPERCDVAIIGAGPAGSATAAHLACAGFDVLLLDRARFPRPKPCAEYVSPGAVDALRRLGALDASGHATQIDLHGPDGGMERYTLAEVGRGGDYAIYSGGASRLAVLRV